MQEIKTELERIALEESWAIAQTERETGRLVTGAATMVDGLVVVDMERPQEDADKPQE